jgi:uncharacterized repeat protein (TIGR03803 family)
MRSGSRVLLASVLTLAGFGVPQVGNGGSPPTHVHYSVLHSFQGAEMNPGAALISDGHGNLYGTTAHGGPWDGGSVFTINIDGTGFQRLHAFAGGANDGFNPEASLVPDDAGNLYGTTWTGGAANEGTVFTIREDGSGFEVLHSFAFGANDGRRPVASLTLDGTGSLYGTTSEGGPSDYGTVFKLKTDGTGFQLLHTFAGGVGDGRIPQASLLLDGSGTLFGTTPYGGHPRVDYPREGFFYDGSGTIFRIKTDGTGFQLLRAFPVDANDGANPTGSVTTDGAGNLYGATGGGGSSNVGTVFRIAKDGSAFQILHSFTWSANDGVIPVGSLVLDRSGTLYGVTSRSGTTFPYQATLFKVGTDATGFQVLRTFIDPPDGTSPSGSLILVGSGVLYGTMADGGSSNSGTVFGVDTDGSGFRVLHAFAGFTGDGSRPGASLIADASGYLYGTTAWGGVPDRGTIFGIRPDGTGFQLLHTFLSGPNDGDTSWSAMVLDRSGNLYGTTPNGGRWNGGTIFRLSSDGSGFQLVHAFQGGAADGRIPGAALTLDGSGNLYGMTAQGGASGGGTVFRVRTDGTGFQLLHTFVGGAGDGAFPYTSLLLDGFGNLYGVTGQGGASNWGTVFKLRTDGTGFQLLHTFVGGDDGINPGGFLTTDGSGTLFGTTGMGGPSGAGTIFRISSDGAGYQVLHAFTGPIQDGIPSAEGGAPSAVVYGFRNLYGTTQVGGPLGRGTVFSIKTDGTGLQILHAFDKRPVDGRNPVCSLLLDSLGNLYGTTMNGGSANFGTVFVLSVNPRIEASGPFVPVRKR